MGPIRGLLTDLPLKGLLEADSEIGEIKQLQGVIGSFEPIQSSGIILEVSALLGVLEVDQ